MSKPTTGLEAYEPRLLEVWRDGGVRRTTLPVGPRAKATTLRHRMYKLRNLMRKHQHPYSEIAERAKISLEQDKTKEDFWNLVIIPADLEFSSILDAAGYREETPEPLDD